MMSWQKSVEIWHLIGTHLHQLSEHPITMTNSNASIQSVSNKISQEAFGGATVRLLNSKFFHIPDVEGTTGK